MTDDLAPLYRDFGQDVTLAGGATLRAVVSTPSRDGFGVRSGARRMRYISADADLAEGDVVTVGGVSRTLIEPPEAINDGSESEVGLN